MDLEELREIKDRAKGQTSMRKTEAEKKVVVCMGTCGIAAGARPVLQEFVEQVNAHNLEDVMVTQAGCKGLCSREPVVDVVTGDTEVTYGDVTPDKAEEIVKKHLIGGKVVEEYTISSE